MLLIAGVFLAYGIDPERVVAEVVTNPPLWIHKPWVRAVALLASGTILVVILIKLFWPRRKKEDVEQTAAPEEQTRPVPTGFKAEGGNLENNVAFGYDVGFDTQNSNLSGNKAFRGAIAEFSAPTGEFSGLSNAELKSAILEIAFQLENIGSRKDSGELSQEECEREFQEFRPKAQSLMLEAIHRIGGINIKPPKEASDNVAIPGGAFVFRAGSLVGAFPEKFAAHFSRFVAEKL